MQTNSKLTQTNTILLLLIYDYNPPKRIAKFKNVFLSGIKPNTLQAGYLIMPMLEIGDGLGPTWPSTATLDPPLTSPPQFIHLHWPLFDHITKTLPCRGMACHHHAISSPGHLWTAPPCQFPPSHSPDHARHGPRRFRAPL